MKKIITSFLLTSILLAVMVSAVVGLTVSSTTIEFAQDSQSKSVVLTNGDDVATIDITTPAVISDGTNNVAFTLSANQFTNVPSNGQNTLTITSSGNPQSLEFGSYSSSFIATATNGVGDTKAQTVNLKAISSFCNAGPVGGNLSISKVDINNKGNGDDDEWEPLDEVEIEVEVENNGNDNVDDVFVELGLFDSNGRNFADDLDFSNVDEEELDLGNIRDGKDETDTFVFRVPPDFDDGTYKLALKAYSDDLGESKECTDSSDDLASDFFESISVDRVSDEERFVVVDDILLNDQATCGETVTGTFTVYNIGDEDQERVLITMKSNTLQIDQEFELTKDLDEGEDEDFSFSFTVPENAANQLHNIEFRTFYDYNRGSYREQSEDKFFGFLNVLGCTSTGGTPGGTPTTGPTILISATLDSEAKSGQELVITGTFTNSGQEAVTVTVDAKAFQSWADLSSISPRVLNLGAGETRSSSFKFNVNEDVSGSQSFVIETNANGKIEVQEVEVNIEGKSTGTNGTGFLTGFSGLNLGESGLIWIIAIVNIILIILIILVAVRISRR